MALSGASCGKQILSSLKAMKKGFLSRSISTIVVAIFACGYLSSCAPQLPSTKEAVASATRYSKDPYNGLSSISGPQISWGFTSGNFINNDYQVSTIKWRLSLLNNKYICLSTHTIGGEWVFLDSAYALGEGELSVPVPPDRETSLNGPIRELISVEIPIHMLKSRKNDGLSIKLQGSRGYIIYTIPAYYIQGFLEAIKE